MLAWISITLYIVCLQNAVNHCFWKEEVYLMVKIQCKLDIVFFKTLPLFALHKCGIWTFRCMVPQWANDCPNDEFACMQSNA